MKDMKRVLIEMLYDEEPKRVAWFPKCSVRLGDPDGYRNESYEKAVQIGDGALRPNVPLDRNGDLSLRL